MPRGLVRTDLNKTGVTSENGNPIPPASPSNNTNPVTWTPSPSHFGNTIPVPDPTFDSNPVTWTPNPNHFGNIFAPTGSPSGFLLEDGSGVLLLEDGVSILLLETSS